MFALHVRVAVNPDAVPVFTAKHLVHRDAVGLAGQVPQGDLNPADPAALTGGTAELPDTPEELFHVAGVFTQDAAFQHFGIDPVAAVPDLAQPRDALVGINLHQGTVHGGADDVREAHIGNLQLARGGAPVERTGQQAFIVFRHEGFLSAKNADKTGNFSGSCASDRV